MHQFFLMLVSHKGQENLERSKTFSLKNMKHDDYKSRRLEAKGVGVDNVM